MSRRMVVGVLFGVVAVGGPLAFLAGADETDRLVFSEESGAETVIEHGEDGFSQGDRFILNGKLFHDGEPVGESMADCVAIAEANVQCTETVVLGDGTIAVVGASHELAFAVGGGTGEFRGATGEMVVEEIDGDTNRITIDLDR